MKTRTKIIIPLVLIGLITAFPLLYLHLNEGFPTYYEGISILIEKEPPKILDQNYDEIPIYVLTKEDFEQVPQVKEMLDVLIKQEFTDKDEGFSYFGEYSREYWINTNPEEISIGIGLPSWDLDKFEKWNSSKPGYLLEYEGVIFQIGFWIS